jgi:AAA family ATP:ADP antiporter
MAARNPFAALLQLERKHLPLALLMFGYFFFVITTFWILKPLKKALFVGYYAAQGGLDLGSWHLSGAQAEQLAKVMNLVVAFVAVVVFSTLARTLRRQQLSYVFCAFSAVALLAFWPLLDAPGPASVWAFYLFGDLFNTVMLTTFFAFLADSFSPADARKSYGPIVLGGVAGGAFGSLVVKAFITRLDLTEWLLVSVGLVAAIAVIAWAAGRQVLRHPPVLRAEAAPEAVATPPKGAGNPALAGARLVARSRYFLAITVMVALYEIVSSVLDFQFTASVEHLVEPTAIGATINDTFTFTNIAALVIQLAFTGIILTRLSMSAALLIMPLAMLVTSVGFLALPVLFLGRALSVVDNALNYSLNQSARETLYTPTRREEKYQAKAFIDMFVQRAGKVMAVGVTLLVTTVLTSFTGVRFLSLFVIVAVLLWMLAARYAGRAFEAMTRDAP